MCRPGVAVAGLALLALALLVLSGCKAAGYSAMYTADALAMAGAYDRAPDLAYGPHPRNRLDVYTPYGRYLRHNLDPQSVLTGRPVVVFFHGGDWSDGYPGKEPLRFIGDALASRGLVAVMVNYRRYPRVRFPAFVVDGARAVAWTQKHIGDYGGDPGRVFVMGHSAGAHIAALLALDPQYLEQAGADPRGIRGLIGLAGPYSFLPMPDVPLLRDLFGPPSRYPQSQPVNYVDAQDPPMLLIAGDRDRRVPMTCLERMVTAVNGAGGRAQAVTFPNLDHIGLMVGLAPLIRWHHPQELDTIARFIYHVGAQPHTDAPPPLRLAASRSGKSEDGSLKAENEPAPVSNPISSAAPISHPPSAISHLKTPADPDG